MGLENVLMRLFGELKMRCGGRIRCSDKLIDVLGKVVVDPLVFYNFHMRLETKKLETNSACVQD